MFKWIQNIEIWIIMSNIDLIKTYIAPVLIMVNVVPKYLSWCQMTDRTPLRKFTEAYYESLKLAVPFISYNLNHGKEISGLVHSVGFMEFNFTNTALITIKFDTEVNYWRRIRNKQVWGCTHFSPGTPQPLSHLHLWSVRHTKKGVIKWTYDEVTGCSYDRPYPLLPTLFLYKHLFFCTGLQHALSILMFTNFKHYLVID